MKSSQKVNIYFQMQILLSSFYRLTIFQGIVWLVQEFFVAKTFEADI